MLRSKLAFVGVAIFIASCSLKAPEHRELLTPGQLNDNPAGYNDKIVAVRGFVKLGPEGHVLYESQALRDEFANELKSSGGTFDARKYNRYCLTIANPGLLYKNWSTINSKTIIVKGKFIDNYLDGTIIDLGACPLPTAIIVDYADLERRYRSLFPKG